MSELYVTVQLARRLVGALNAVAPLSRRGEVWGRAGRIPTSPKHPTVGTDERSPPSQITLSAQTASFTTRCLSDAARWDVTPIIASRNKAPCLARSARLCTATVITTIIWLPRNMKWWRGSCRNLHCALWSGRFKQSELSFFAQGVKGTVSCPASSACLNHLYCRDYFGYKSYRAIKITH